MTILLFSPINIMYIGRYRYNYLAIATHLNSISNNTSYFCTEPMVDSFKSEQCWVQNFTLKDIETYICWP